MMRRYLHRVTKIPYKDIHLARTDKGKPYLTNELPEDLVGLTFNVSHHGDLVVLAGETQGELGVDVMKLETPGTCAVKLIHCTFPYFKPFPLS